MPTESWPIDSNDDVMLDMKSWIPESLVPECCSALVPSSPDPLRLKVPVSFDRSDIDSPVTVEVPLDLELCAPPMSS